MSVDPKTQSLFEAIAANNYIEVKRAIDAGASVNSLNARDRTPLAVARFQGNLEIVELLLAAGALMEVSVVSTPAHPSPQLVTMSGDWDFQSIEYELPESPTRDRQIAYEDLTYLQSPAPNVAQVEQLVTSGGEEFSSTDAASAKVHLDAMTAVWQEMGADPDVTYTFDLDAVFDAHEQAANKASLTDIQLFDRQDMFEEELTITSFRQPTNDTEYDSGETYVFDLDADLDRLTTDESIVADDPDEMFCEQSVEWDDVQTYFIEDDATHPPNLDNQSESEARDLARLPIEPLLERINTPEWAEGETYAIDLEDLNDLALIPASTAGQKLPGEIDASFLTTMSSNQDATGDLDLQTDTHIDGAWRVESAKPAKQSPIEESATNASLMAAVIAGDLELAQLALNAGACVDRYDWDLGYSPLGMAIVGGTAALKNHGNLNVVKFLLAAGANPHHGSISTTALGLAAERGEIGAIELLLQHSLDVNQPVAQDGWTALLVAVANGHLAVVQLLVTAGANINIWSRGETPILLAAKCEQREIYQYLYRLVNISLRLCANRDGEKLLQASQNRRTRRANHLVEKSIAMATAGNIPQLNLAISAGVEINAIGAQGHTALMAAAYYGQDTTIDILLRHGADLNLLSDGEDGLGCGMTALMFAAGSFFPSNRHLVVSKLIAAGADLERQSPNGKTAISYSALTGCGDRNSVEKLIGAGANLNLRDKCGYTILMRLAAAENYQMFNLFLQSGASAEGIESIQLIQAATKGHLDRVRSILAAPVNLDLDRGAALGNAVAAGHTEIVELLLRAGANPHLVTHTGFTLIESATLAGYGGIVELLITAGAIK